MKRISNLFHKICSEQNLRLADSLARKGKKGRGEITLHDRNREANITALRQSLLDKTYKTSAYTTFKIYEPKERLVYRLPYYPDRIMHHAIMNVLEGFFVSLFTADSYSCIKGRGIHAASRAVRRSLRDVEGTQYCLKLDVRKFYPSIDHDVLKELLRRKLKDQDLLWLLDEIIDSADGLPIGNYLSQYLANFYLTFFDHWIKEVKGVKYYFRYADDLVILAGSKEYLHDLFKEISGCLSHQLKLSVKDNYQIFPVDARSLDFVGYRFFHSHTLLRKSIKQSFARKAAKGIPQASVASYWGWAKHCDSKRLLSKILNTKS